ncbi:branched-chain amino acid ABC transporter substrate-binding protein [Amphritea sp. 1_MG-2023]|uniref:branched-chain amino acid ABC transporter substrate-binding protein n=1 Tax=Amphritea sp. 1_MG-2023 TaxID=3062670 RepID=UPI0026E29954|nr:branched-chain amino acid ABC transporter substrate-binding protein [Amphritea sp. 1_MG-2023]MDO6564638.1 branched-chain amino acid ABC transporter substrate-binding protein [Amphritea sp. 1_MG-2023]
MSQPTHPFRHSAFKPTLPTLFALLLWLCSINVQADNPPAVIAIAGPMAGSSLSIGLQYRAGVTAAIQSLTEDGMLLGRKMTISLHDDNCNAEIAASLAEQIVLTPPAVVIGHSCSAATIAAAPIYAKHNVLEITPASTHPQVTEMGINSIFRMIGRDDQQGSMAADYIARHYQNKHIGIVYFPGEYSKNLALLTLSELEKRQIKPVKSIQTIALSASYTKVIAELLSADVDALYIVGGGLDTAIFLKEARQLGAKFKVIGSDTFVSNVFIKTAGEAANGSVFTFPPETAKLQSSMPAQTAIRALGQEPAGYTLLAYAATQAWILGVQKAQSFEAEQVANALRAAPLETILGPISFDAKGDIMTSYSPFSWYIWTDGKRAVVN